MDVGGGGGGVPILSVVMVNFKNNVNNEVQKALRGESLFIFLNKRQIKFDIFLLFLNINVRVFFA